MYVIHIMYMMMIILLTRIICVTTLVDSHNINICYLFIYSLLTTKTHGGYRRR